MGQHLTPTCDVCGTEKQFRHGIGSFCPNDNCGGTATPETLRDDAPPLNGKFVRLTEGSVNVVMEDKLRSQPMLEKIDVVGLYGGLSDGTTRRITSLLVEIKHPLPNRRPGPTRTTRGGKMHPKGVTIGLATRDGVDVR